jgi:hypothetical protein
VVTFLVRALTPSRLKCALLVSGMLLMALPPCVRAQEDTDAPLGDVARSFRKRVAAQDVVIDNDNFSQVVVDAEKKRAAGSLPVFSLDPGGNSVHVSSADVTCSLSFSPKSASLRSDSLLLDELPRTELAKLDGPAAIDGDSLQVSMHNGTTWELREVVIGLTIVKRPQPGDTAAYSGGARIIPAVADDASLRVQDSFPKQPDVTLLLHVRGSAAASTTAIFRTPLNFSLFPDQEWHWAIVKARGIPPQAPPEATMVLPEQGAAPASPALPGLVPQIPAPIPLPLNPPASNPDAPAH